MSDQTIVNLIDLPNQTKLRLFLTLRAVWQRAEEDDFEECDMSPRRIYREIERRGSEAEKATGKAFLDHWNGVTLYVRGSSAPKGGRGVLVLPWLGHIPTNPFELLRGFNAGEAEGGASREPSAPSSQGTPSGGQDVGSEPRRVEMPPTSDRVVTRQQHERLFVLQWGDFVSIPAGEFLMGDDDRNDNPRHTVYLDAYHISKYPVTVKQYMAFVKSAGHRKPVKPPWGWKNDHPIVGVSWDDATAYCQWLSTKTGKKITLPTEAQWEKASRCTDGRRYPWGEDWDHSRLQCSKKDWGDAGGTATVGSYPGATSPYGVLDMAGNVWEWCSDWYDANHMTSAPALNPAGPVTGSSRVVRGGSWGNFIQGIFRCAYRGYYDPAFRNDFIGFRYCVSGLPK